MHFCIHFKIYLTFIFRQIMCLFTEIVQHFGDYVYLIFGSFELDNKIKTTLSIKHVATTRVWLA